MSVQIGYCRVQLLLYNLYLITRGITSSLQEIETFVSQPAEGKLKVNILDESKDESGNLSKSVHAWVILDHHHKKRNPKSQM